MLSLIAFLALAVSVPSAVVGVRISYFDSDAPLCLQFGAENSFLALSSCVINLPSQDFIFKASDAEDPTVGILLTSTGLCAESTTSGRLIMTDSLRCRTCMSTRDQLFRVDNDNDMPPSRPPPIATVSVRAPSGKCWQNNGSAGSALSTAPCSDAESQNFNIMRNLPYGGLFIQSFDNSLCVGLAVSIEGGYQMESCSGLNTQTFRNRTAIINGASVLLVNFFTPRLCVSEKSDSGSIGNSNCDTTAAMTVVTRRTIANDGGDAAAGVPADAFRFMDSNNRCLTVVQVPAGQADVRPNFQPCTNNNTFQWWYNDFGRLVTKAIGRPVCMDVYGVDTRPGQIPGLYDCRIGSNQVLLVTPRGGNKVSLRFGHSYRCMDLRFEPSDGRTFPVQNPCNDNPSQIFSTSKPDAFITRVSPSCTSVKARKEWRDMSTVEKEAYFNAVQKLRTTPSKAGRRSFYDDLVAVHAGTRGYIHGTTAFLPWHRAFLQIYEEALQKIDPNVVLPYWAWARDGPFPLTSPTIGAIFSTDRLSLGQRGETSTSCVRGGIAQGWTDYDWDACTTRFYADDFTVPIQTTLQAFVTNAETFDSFAYSLEQSHNTVHMNVGGTENTDMWIVARSPNDPTFFFHHTNVDRYWYLWQLEHPNVAVSFSGAMNVPNPDTPDTPIVSIDLTVDSILPGFNIPIREAMTLGSYGYCSTYQPYSADLTTHSKTRRALELVNLNEGNMTSPILNVTNSDMTLPVPGAGSSKPYFPPPVDGKVYGSGHHGTLPAPPPVQLSVEYIESMHPKVLFGLGKPTREELDKHVRMVREKEKAMTIVQDQVAKNLDAFLEEHPGDFVGASEKAVEKVVVPVLSEHMEIGSNATVTGV
ncbi:hypothetical protein HDU67_001568 [Dinochytrium kinnereticum]|nr:hypothetical protein HDU67_001568 [Dinochytrium kinnereticum]